MRWRLIVIWSGSHIFCRQTLSNRFTKLRSDLILWSVLLNLVISRPWFFCFCWEQITFIKERIWFRLKRVRRRLNLSFKTVKCCSVLIRIRSNFSSSRYCVLRSIMTNKRLDSHLLQIFFCFLLFSFHIKTSPQLHARSIDNFFDHFFLPSLIGANDLNILLFRRTLWLSSWL